MTKRRLIIIAALAALAALLAIPAVVMGDATHTTTVTGIIGATYSLTSPDTISLGDFISATNYNSSNQTISANASGSSATSVTISVSGSNGGYLSKDNGGAIKLDNPLSVKGGDISSYTPITSAQTLENSGILSGGTYSINDFSVQQTITSNDLNKTAGTYSITLTFTATFN